MGCVTISPPRNNEERIKTQPAKFRNIPNKTKKTFTGNDPQMHFASLQMNGWKSQMEDRTLYHEIQREEAPVHLFGVFDGHGGAQIAEYLASRMAEWLTSDRDFQRGYYIDGLKNTFLNIDKFLYTFEGEQELQTIHRQILHEKPIFHKLNTQFMGSTAVIILLTEDQIYVAHVGNSKAVLVKGVNQIYQTEDHTVDNAAELDRIMNQKGSIEHGELISDLSLSRGFGDYRYKEEVSSAYISARPEIRHFSRTDADLILLGSDGLWKSDTNQTVIQLKSEISSVTDKSTSQCLKKALENYVDKHIAIRETQHEGKDSMSGILIKLCH